MGEVKTPHVPNPIQSNKFTRLVCASRPSLRGARPDPVRGGGWGSRSCWSYQPWRSQAQLTVVSRWRRGAANPGRCWLRESFLPPSYNSQDPGRHLVVRILRARPRATLRCRSRPDSRPNTRRRGPPRSEVVLRSPTSRCPSSWCGPCRRETASPADGPSTTPADPRTMSERDSQRWCVGVGRGGGGDGGRAMPYQQYSEHADQSAAHDVYEQPERIHPFLRRESILCGRGLCGLLAPDRFPFPVRETQSETHSATESTLKGRYLSSPEFGEPYIENSPVS